MLLRTLLLVAVACAPRLVLAEDEHPQPTQSALPAEAESQTAGHAQTATHGEGEKHEGAEHEGEEHAVPWYRNVDLWKVINLLVLLYIGMRMGLRGIGPALRQRSNTIRTELDTAHAALESAEKRYDDAEYRLARLHDEIEELRQDGRRFAQSDRERIIANAHLAAEQIGAKNRVQIQLLTESSKRELRQFMAELVVGRVRQELQNKVARQGDAPFVQTILQQVEALPAQSG